MCDLVDAADRLGAWPFICVLLALGIAGLWMHVRALHGERREELWLGVQAQAEMTNALNALKDAVQRVGGAR